MGLFGWSRSDKAGHRRKAAFDITISSTTSANVRQYRISKQAVVFLVTALGSVLLVFIVSAAMYGHLMRRAADARRLHAENAQIRQQLMRLAELEGKIEHLDATRRALLWVVGVEEPEVGSSRESVSDRALDVHSAVYHGVDPGGALSEEDLRELRRILPKTPLAGPQTRGFGLIRDTGAFHTGIDIAGESGSAVCAAGDGIISFVGTHEAFGLVVVIAHSPGFKTMYGHNSRILVRVGDYVSAGEKISEVGNTGHSTAPHLHFEVHSGGRAIDPALVNPIWHPGPFAIEEESEDR